MRGARSAGGLGVLLAFGFFVSLAAVRCTYSPDFPSGELHCSTVHSCPEGYVCDMSSNFCNKKGDPTGAAGTGGATGAAGAAGAGMAGSGGHSGAGGAIGVAGMGGAGGAKGPPCGGTCMIKIDGTLMNANTPMPTDKFVGHWLFQPGSTETVTCSDGSDKTNDLSATMDYVDVTDPSGALTGSYFCDWDLTAGLAMTTIKAGQSCSRNVTDTKTGVTKFTWHGQTFTLTVRDNALSSATLSATIDVDYVDDASKTGCSP